MPGAWETLGEVESVQPQVRSKAEAGRLAADHTAEGTQEVA